MKYLKYIGLSLMLSLGILTSCNSFLNVDSSELTTETFYKTESELKSALIGVYAPINFDEFYGNFYPTYLAGGDDLSFFQRNNPANPPTSIIMGNANSSTAEIATLWKALYEGINRANLLLENVDRNTELDQTLRNRIRAEAQFLRGFYHFHLVQGWGDVPIVLETLKSLGTHIYVSRDDKEKVYDQIIQDITEALPNLPQITDLKHSGTITQTAAKGILARIYLFRAGEHNRDKTPAGANVDIYYAEALKWAKEVKDSGIHNLAPDYSLIFIDYSKDKYNSQPGSYESMWEAEMTGNRDGEIQAAGRIGNTIGFGSKNDYSQVEELKSETGMRNPGYSYRFIYASLKLYQMYDEEKDVKRGDWNIAPFEYTYSTSKDKEVIGRTYFFGKKPAGLNDVEGMPCTEFAANHNESKALTRCAAKFRREYEVVSPKSKNFTPINYPILRYSDVLLMLAEAENHLNGPTALAYECINEVRTRAGIKVLSGLDQASFLTAIKKERAMELCFESLRRWDLIRWGDFYTTMQNMPTYVRQAGWGDAHKYAEGYYKVTSAYNFFPIPDMERSANPNLTQNPGW